MVFLLGVPFCLGKLFGASEEAPPKAPVAKQPAWEQRRSHQILIFLPP